MLSRGGVVYLDFNIDNRLLFNEHIKQKIDKANKVLACLRRTAAANWELTPEIMSIMYRTVIEQILTYCSEVLIDRLCAKYFEKKLRAIQRKCCLAITRAPATALSETVIFISGLLPIDAIIMIKHQQKLAIA